jgi:hypothetical protein
VARRDDRSASQLLIRERSFHVEPSGIVVVRRENESAFAGRRFATLDVRWNVRRCSLVYRRSRGKQRWKIEHDIVLCIVLEQTTRRKGEISIQAKAGERLNREFEKRRACCTRHTQETWRVGARKSKERPQRTVCAKSWREQHLLNPLAELHPQRLHHSRSEGRLVVAEAQGHLASEDVAWRERTEGKEKSG